MGFFQSSEISEDELRARIGADKNILSFGLKYLDDAMLGIMPNDLVLLGASSGVGKTAFCCNLAKANIDNGKKVHFFALEAEKYEIERRIKFSIFMNELLKQSYNDRRVWNISYAEWLIGKYWEQTKEIELIVDHEFKKTYQTLFTFYKENVFDVNSLIQNVTQISTETDLIIVDHVHYFDYDSDKESNSIKEIAKAARMLALENGKPIILISHLRKRDKHSNDICPGLEEFHGSSDLYKIATKAITLAPGVEIIDSTGGGGRFETFVRIVKNRIDGGVTRYMGKTIYNLSKGIYEDTYQIGTSSQSSDKGFVALDEIKLPRWKDRTEGRSSNNRLDNYKQVAAQRKDWA